MWLGEVFEHRDKQHHIQGFALELRQRLLDCPLVESKSFQRLQLGRDLEIHSDAALQFGSKAINWVAR